MEHALAVDVDPARDVVHGLLAGTPGPEGFEPRGKDEVKHFDAITAIEIVDSSPLVLSRKVA